MNPLFDFSNALTASTGSDMGGDLINTLVLLVLAVLVAIAYSLRIVTRGPAHFDRIDKQGGSSLLSKGVMEAAYWSLQPLAKLLMLARVTPNMLTWASVLFGAFSGLCLAFGHFGFGAVFLVIAGLMDALDGMIARILGEASDAGAVLDSSVDRYVEFFFFAGLAVHWAESTFLLISVMFALLGSFMVTYSTAKAEALQITPPRGNMKRSERMVYLILGAVLSPLTIPTIEQNYVHSINKVGYPMVGVIVLIAVLANVSAIERLMAVAKAARARQLAKLNEAVDQMYAENADQVVYKSLNKSGESIGKRNS